MEVQSPSWTYAGRYDATGPGYATSGVEIYRGPKHRLVWAPIGVNNPQLHPASLEIKADESLAVLRLYNPKTFQETLIPIPITSPIKVNSDGVDLVVGRPERQIKWH